MKRSCVVGIGILWFMIVSLALAYQESPMMADQVAAGTLPPVDERLPLNPAVVEPFNEIGEYGGTFRMGFTGTNPGWGGLWFVTGWENLVQWNADFSGVQPNIAESWEVSDDVTEFTFHLREGMKWSDGEPFTTEDIDFYVNDIVYNEELSPGGPGADWLPRAEADTFEFTVVDDTTFIFKFANPQGTLLYNLAQWNGRHIAFFPKHYLMQFHAKYNPDVDQIVQQTDGVEDWVGLFNLKASGPTDDTQGFYNQPERPLLFPWIVKQPLGAGTQITMERNPYYYKVDTEGNQLPYIDTVVGVAYQDGEARTFAMLNGDVDYVKDPGGENRIIYHQAVDDGKPLYIRYNNSDGGVTNTVHFNQNAQDPVKAAVFANKDFRIGMSHAINRPEIIEIVNNGQGTPSQPAPLESSPLYNEQLATQYTEYNPELANEYLDKVLPDKDAEGFRLDENGNRFTVIFTVVDNYSWGGSYVDTAELLIGYWRDVGVDVVLNTMSDDQFGDVWEQNEFEATLFTGEGGAGITGILDPRYYAPGEYGGWYGNGWNAWRTNSQEAVQVEMPQWAQDWRAQYDAVLKAPTAEEQIAQMQEVLATTAEVFPVIGIARPGDGYYPHASRLQNIPETWIDGWIEGVQKIQFPEQWYLRSE